MFAAALDLAIYGGKTWTPFVKETFTKATWRVEISDSSSSAHDTMKPCVACSIDLAHAALAKGRQDFVGAEHVTGG